MFIGKVFGGGSRSEPLFVDSGVLGVTEPAEHNGSLRLRLTWLDICEIRVPSLAGGKFDPTGSHPNGWSE